MAERGTHEIETPIEKHKVVVKDWMTGGEKRELSRHTEQEAAAVAAVKALVVSIDGKPDNIIETMDAMHGKDFDFIMAEITSVGELSSYQKKTS